MPDVPSAEEMAATIYYTPAPRMDQLVPVLADWEQRIRAATLSPFYDLIEWDSEENLQTNPHSPHDRWIALGNRLRSLLPPKEAPDA